MGRGWTIRTFHVRIPCGKATEPMRKPVSVTTFLGTAAKADTLTMGAVSICKLSACMYPYTRHIIGRDSCYTTFDTLNQLIDGRRSNEACWIPYNRVRPHSSVACFSLEQFRLAGEIGCGKAGCCAPLANAFRILCCPPTSTAVTIQKSSPWNGTYFKGGSSFLRTR